MPSINLSLVKRFCILILLINLAYSGLAQKAGPFRTSFYDADTLKMPFKAFVLSNIPNAAIISVDRFVYKSEFAYINGNSITNNFLFSSLWDNDLFGTNLLGHPFHGSLDFSAARASGMSYWQSIPYTFAASFAWEFLLENEPPSFNDQFATTIGGAILGEISYRLSSSIVDNNTRGFERIIRELLGTLTCPMNGVERLITGKMWKHSPYPIAQAVNYFPISFGAKISGRHVTALNRSSKHRFNPQIEGWFHYGAPFRRENSKPLDYFKIDLALDASSKTSLLSKLNAIGMLYSKEITVKQQETQLLWGFFQHYVYTDNDPINNDSIATIRYAEPASIGAGIIRHQNFHSGNKWETEAYLNAVILAAANATYFNLKGRQYNFGQGYSIKLANRYRIKKIAEVGLHTNLLHYFTWKGYKKGTDFSTVDFRKFNSMGDKGNTLVATISPALQLNLNNYFSIQAASSLYLQQNFNRQQENSHYRFIETNIAIKYCY